MSNWSRKIFAFHFEPYCTGIRRDDRTDLTTKSDIFSRKETVTSKYSPRHHRWNRWCWCCCCWDRVAWERPVWWLYALPRNSSASGRGFPIAAAGSRGILVSWPCRNLPSTAVWCRFARRKRCSLKWRDMKRKLELQTRGGAENCFGLQKGLDTYV